MEVLYKEENKRFRVLHLRKSLIVALVLIILAVQPLASADEPTRSVVYRIQKVYQVPNYSSSTATDVVATIYIFDNRSEWASQQVLSEQIEVSDPSATYEILRTSDNRVARVLLGTIHPGTSKTITIIQIVKVDHVDLKIDPNEVHGDIPVGLLEYTRHVAYLWESDDPTIKNKALELTENQANFYHKAKQIFDFVKGYLTYAPTGPEHSALWAYTNRSGDCSEFTHLFIALARAAGIPANFISGYGYDPTKGNELEQMGHAFAFAYLPNVGWIPVDEVWSRPEGEFGKLSQDHLILLTSDGKDLVRGTQIKIPGNKTSYRYSGLDPDITLEETAEITREVAVETTLSAAPQMRNRTWTFYVKVKNDGTRAIENIQVELQADEDYFDVPQAQSISRLEAGHNQQVSFDIHVKATVEKSPIQATATYDNPYGSFVARSNEVLASPTILEMMNLIWIAIFVAMAGAAIGIAVAVIRRR